MPLRQRQRLDDADITGTELIGVALVVFTFIAGFGDWCYYRQTDFLEMVTIKASKVERGNWRTALSIIAVGLLFLLNLHITTSEIERMMHPYFAWKDLFLFAFWMAPTLVFSANVIGTITEPERKL